MAAHRSNRAHALLACLATVLATNSRAARPLATDDAGANAQAQCQIEAWVDSTADTHSQHLAPACGVLDGLELGVELVRVTPSDQEARAQSMAVKWAPEWASWQGWRFGVKAGTSRERDVDNPRWHQSVVGFSGVASLPLDAQWAMHLNVGRERNKLDHVSANHYGLALTWAPHERWLVFAEVVGHSNTPATQAAGVRWWLLQEQLGLDATTSRSNATSESRAWGIGLGWYGIKF